MSILGFGFPLVPNYFITTIWFQIPLLKGKGVDVFHLIVANGFFFVLQFVGAKCNLIVQLGEVRDLWRGEGGNLWQFAWHLQGGSLLVLIRRTRLQFPLHFTWLTTKPAGWSLPVSAWTLSLSLCLCCCLCLCLWLSTPALRSCRRLSCLMPLTWLSDCKLQGNEQGGSQGGRGQSRAVDPCSGALYSWKSNVIHS